jgi:pimeloyl-ACP methyl ester carboxylesterase
LLAVDFDVRAVANPLRGLAADTRYVEDLVSEIEGRVLLVGHSYGGAVITSAAGQLANAVGLVFITNQVSRMRPRIHSGHPHA